jgi:hypothetical protein
MQPTDPNKNKIILSLFSTYLVIYLFLFSSFALFHAYSENELTDSHRCAIGFCVQQGQATPTFLAAPALFLIPSFRNTLPRSFLEFESPTFQITSRGPPSL